MPSTSRLLLSLGLLLLACSIPCARSQNEATQIAPSSTLVDAASANDVSETINPTSSDVLSGSEGVIQPSMADAASSSVNPQQSVDGSALSADAGSSLQLTSSVDAVSAVNSLDLSASEVPVASANTVVVGTTDALSSLDSMDTMTSVFSAYSASQSTFLVQSTAVVSDTFSVDVQPTTVMPDQSASLSMGNASTNSVILNVSATAQSPEMSASVAPEIASLSASMSLASASVTATAEISPSSTVSTLPSSSVPVPGGSPAGGSSSQQEEKQKDGGGGGMSSGAKAAVGIFVSLAIVGLIAVVVVLYRRNYLTPRNIKSLMKGGVRYQTHNDSMSYNDEGMLILPDRR